MEKSLSDKNMLEMIVKCEISHKKFLELLKDVEGCVDEAKALYQYGVW